MKKWKLIFKTKAGATEMSRPYWPTGLASDEFRIQPVHRGRLADYCIPNQPVEGQHDASRFFWWLLWPPAAHRLSVFWTWSAPFR